MTIYRVIGKGLSGGSLDDLLEITAPASACFTVRKITFTYDGAVDDTNPGHGQYNLQLVHISGAFTPGSGGSSVTISTPPGYPAPLITATQDNSTIASGGSTQILAEFWDMHDVGSQFTIPPHYYEERWIAPTDAFIVRCQSGDIASGDYTVTTVVEQIG